MDDLPKWKRDLPTFDHKLLNDAANLRNKSRTRSFNAEIDVPPFVRAGSNRRSAW